MATKKPAKKPTKKKPSEAKSNSLESIRKRTTRAAKSLSKVDRAREKVEKDELLKPITLRLQEIKSRPGRDTRFLNIKHVLQLAESILTLGLLEPLVVDREGHLLAGGHRLAAIRLLCEEPERRMERLEELCGKISKREKEKLEERLTFSGIVSLDEDLEDLSKVPVRVMEFDATKEEDKALAIEVTENSQRRDYTGKEIVGLYHRLIDAGYTTRPGKPKEGERPAKPAVAMVIGKSVKTVERLLKEERLEGSQAKSEERNERMLVSLGKLEGAIKRVLTDASKLEQKDDELSATARLIVELQRQKLYRLIRQTRLEVS